MTPSVSSDNDLQSSHADKTVASRSTALLLGRTQGLRGSSEIMAGARAEFSPSPITLALSSLGGRVTARTVINIGLQKAAVNFFAARMAVMTDIVMRRLQDKEQPLMVDLAAGFSPLGYQVAQAAPQARVMEIDLANVLQDKRKRLHKGHIDLPPNLELVEANLGEISLHDVLQGRKADVITYTGIYFTMAEQITVARYLQENLSPDGTLICMTQWKEGQKQIREATRFFRSQTGETPGVWENETAAAKIFTDAGFNEVRVVYPSQIGAKINATLPLMDVELIIVAKN